MERVRVVGLEGGVADAVVDGLVSKRMLGIKLYDLFNPKTCATDVVDVWGTNVGKTKMVTDADRPVQPNERVARNYV